MASACKGNLLMVSNYPSDTGYAWWLMEHFWKTLANMFVQDGKKAYLAYPKITTISETITSSPIDPVELTIPWNNNDEAERVFNFIKTHNISYIYFTDQPYLSMKYIKMRLHGVKRIINHDHAPGDRPPVTGIKGILKYIINSVPWYTVNKVFCISDLMKQRSILNGRVPERKCIVVQNGITPISCPNTYHEARRSLGINESTFLVITTGRAHTYKRFDFIIESARLLLEGSPDLDIKFTLVGDGPAMPELKTLVKKYHLEHHVLLLGFRSDIHSLLCESNLAFHAALGEGFSLSIIEYMSAGLPVLVPDIPSVSQAIDDNINGFIYPFNQTEHAATKIKFLAENPDKARCMGKKSKEKADIKYGLMSCTSDFEQGVRISL